MDKESLPTPVVADACLRLRIPLRVGPPGLRAVGRSLPLSGAVRPARHYGSVDVFLEAYEQAAPGDVLVIDNGGRVDEACIGDLTVLEARAAGLAGMIVFGLHRDTPELEMIGFPVYSYGTFPGGPTRLDPREPEALTTARFGDFEIGSADHVFADADGVVFVPSDRVEDVQRVGGEIQRTERAQAGRIAAGETLRDQLRFGEYLERSASDPGYSFRAHLREIGGAIEE